MQRGSVEVKYSLEWHPPCETWVLFYPQSDSGTHTLCAEVETGVVFLFLDNTESFKNVFLDFHTIISIL